MNAAAANPYLSRIVIKPGVQYPEGHVSDKRALQFKKFCNGSRLVLRKNKSSMTTRIFKGMILKRCLPTPLNL